MRPRHPGARVIVGIVAFLCVLVPVPVSTSRGSCGGSRRHRRLVLLPLAGAVHGAPGCPVGWPGLRPRRRFVAVSVLALPSTLRAVARSSGGGCWVVLVVLLCRAFIDAVLLVVGLPLVTVVVVCPFVVGVGVVLSRPVVFVGVAPSPFRHCGLSPYSLCDLLVSTPRAAARGGGVLVAVVVVFASPSIPVPVVPFCRCPDPLSIPRAGARSGGVCVRVLSGHRLVVNNIDRT
jgi:hypothetical protein